MYLLPILRCKNSDCPLPVAAPIRLPYAKPPKADAKAPNWPPNGWQIRLICHGCDHWYVYEKKDVVWEPSLHTSAETGLDWWQVDQLCGEPGCNSRTSWFLINTGGMSESEVCEFVMRADPIPVCGNDHSLGISGIKEKTAKPISSVEASEPAAPRAKKPAPRPKAKKAAGKKAMPRSKTRRRSK